MLKIVIGFPSRSEEKEVVRRMARTGEKPVVRQVASPEQLLEAREVLDTIVVDEKIVDYVIELVHATRNPAEHGLPELEPLIQFGASPRASIALTQAGRGRAFLEGRGFVLPQDVKSVAFDVLRHRVVTTYEAEAEGLTSENVIRAVLDAVPVP